MMIMHFHAWLLLNRWKNWTSGLWIVARHDLAAICTAAQVTAGDIKREALENFAETEFAFDIISGLPEFTQEAI